ncbi:hypothetical protein [Aliiroseovarius sp. S253]|uniref:hypothetical protein n=1 Tax=Aliiroseovarius sp. S253 TaxID=3415133 RepID=UPI003C7A490A
MAEPIRSLTIDASKSLTLLSKIRCVENFHFSEEHRKKNLFSWPNSKYLDEKSKVVLRERGIRFDDHRVSSFSVPYSTYGQMRKVALPEIDNIRLTRVLLDVFRVATESPYITGITAAWDTRENSDVIAPTSMSDTQGLKRFATKKDAYLVLHREGEKYDIKLRAPAYRAALYAKPELKSLSVESSDLRTFSGNSVDNMGRKNRHIVFKAQSKYLVQVLQQTVNSVERLIDRQDLVDIIQQSFREQ